MSTDSVTAKWADCGNDSEVEEIAEWVIDQYNQAQNEKLKLVRVIAADITTVGEFGTLYRLLLEVIDEDGVYKRCEALVLVELEGSKVLLEFYFVEFDQEIIGGWTDAGHDVGIEDMAKFAVDEYNKKEGTTLEFTELENAQKQLVAGILYRLTLEAIDNGHQKGYQALVLVIPWEKIKELEDFKPKEKLELVRVLGAQKRNVDNIGIVLYKLLLEVKDADGRHKRCEALVLVKPDGRMKLLEFYFVEFNQEIIGGWTDAGNDVGIEDLAKFAVDEYNKKEGTTLEFTKLKNAQKKLVDGILYRLTLEAIDDGHKNLYQAMVIVIRWENIKELEDFKPLLLNDED